MRRFPFFLAVAFLLPALSIAQAQSNSLDQSPTLAVHSPSSTTAPIIGVTAPPEQVLASEEGLVESPEGDSEAGAAGGEHGSFSLSKGGLAAIIVIVVVVVVIGIGSATLYVIAKRRQWEVRKSIVRASKRLTGKFDARKSQRQARRSGIRLDPASRKGDLEKGRVPATVEAKFDAGAPRVAFWKAKFSKPEDTQAK